MEWKDVTPAGAKEKKHCILSCWLLSFYALAVLRFITSCGSLLSIEALKKAFWRQVRDHGGALCCTGTVASAASHSLPTEEPIDAKGSDLRALAQCGSHGHCRNVGKPELDCDPADCGRGFRCAVFLVSAQVQACKTRPYLAASC